MEKIKCVFLFATFIIALPFLVNAQQQASVEETVTMFIKALETADKGVLNSLVSDKLSYGHSSGRIENKNEFVASLVSGSSDFIKIDIADQSITELKDMAIVRHNLMATTNDSGKPGKVKLHVMLVWQNNQGHWLLVARQATKIP